MGLFIRGEMSTLFINLGILMFSLAVLFQIITLPVEFNASGRALKILKNSGMLYESEVREARSVLTAAAAYLCGECSICTSAAFKNTDPDRRKKK